MSGGGAHTSRVPLIHRNLPFREPLQPDNLFGHLAATAVPGVEEWHDGAYRCTLRLPGGPGVAALRPPQAGTGQVACTLRLADAADAGAAVAVCRRLLDLDADPAEIDAHLARDRVLAPLVAGAPGRRVPGTAHGEEFALRAVLGQQVSTAAARTHAARLVTAYGQPVDDPDGGLTHLFPLPRVLAEIDPAALGLPQARRETFLRLARALAGGDVDLSPGADPVAAVAALAAMPGIGPWTVGTVAMRALGDRDAFLPGDLGVRLAAARLGLPATPGALSRRAQPWRPWRAYAVQHLWATGDHAVNRMPTAQPAASAASNTASAAAPTSTNRTSSTDASGRSAKRRTARTATSATSAIGQP
jgi:AraC family transcriptional regulator of adaptative response / DNA-3-methyladenine glycosylase II